MVEYDAKEVRTLLENGINHVLGCSWSPDHEVQEEGLETLELVLSLQYYIRQHPVGIAVRKRLEEVKRGIREEERRLHF